MKILVYMPLSWPNIPSKTFKSFLDMTRYPIEGVKLDVLVSDTYPLCRNRNEAVELATSSKYDADAIFFADADHVFPETAVKDLLDHLSDDFPVVTGIYWRKGPPNTCVAGFYSPWTKDMEMKRASLEKNGFLAPDGSQCLFYRPLKDFDTIQPIDVCGMGCVLVRTDVIKKLELPYFGYVNAYTTGGDYTINHCSEEMIFWAQLKKKGIKALVVPSVRCGHITEKVIGGPEIA